jgi:hypothetical protein
MLSVVLARATAGPRIDGIALVNTGIIVNPVPMPNTNSLASKADRTVRSSR